MEATFEAIVDAAMQLAPADRCRVAEFLWKSAGGAMNEDFEETLNRREVELDQDPSKEINQEEFMSHFASRRRV